MLSGALDHLASLAGLVPLAFAAAAGATVLVCWLLMWVLKRNTGLPMAISALVVPIVVGSGFAIAVVAHLYLRLSVLPTAAVAAATLVPVALLYEHRYGEPT